MYQGSKGLLDYSATKGAITAFTRSLSENLIEKGIRVNGVAPGPIWTPLNPRGGAPAEKVASSGESRSEEHTSEPHSLMRITYAAYYLTKQRNKNTRLITEH